MKREIKFRAFIIKSWNNKEWVTKKMIYNSYPNKTTVVFDRNKYNLSFCYYHECEIMQYTGLKDKNGVEIYEGDIVHSSYEMQGTEDGKEFFKTGKYKHDFFQVVEFKDGAFWSGSLMKGKTHEVIGNIYENPELL